MHSATAAVNDSYLECHGTQHNYTQSFDNGQMAIVLHVIIVLNVTIFNVVVPNLQL
jgi:hypothetical protein